MMTSATGVLHFGVIRHEDREPVTAWYGKPESTTRRWEHSPQAYEGQRPRGPWLLVHQQRTQPIRQGDRRPELARNPYASAHRWAGIVKGPAPENPAPVP